MSDTKELIREAQVEEAKWRFFSVYRQQLQDCTANEDQLEAELAWIIHDFAGGKRKGALKD
jgi:hypothetical protein